MTREQLKALLPEGIEDAAVTKVLDAMHAEIAPHKEAAKKAQDSLAAKIAEMDAVSKKAATADEKTRAYEELQQKYARDLQAANERAAALEFDGTLDAALREKGARSLKAARALLDVDALRASKDRTKDIAAAIEALAGAEESAFLFQADPTGGQKDVGGDAGGRPPAADDMAAVRAAAGLK